jgi:predicted GIY-YIG superfamily endonuclease
MGYPWYVYILLCSDNTLYTGATNNLEKRIQTHNEGKGAKYTKARLPVRLVWHQSFPSRSQALKYEIYIKGLTRRQKEKFLEMNLCTI